MGRDGRRRPRELLRDAALSLERLAAAGMVGGAVEGASDQLQRELPELNGKLRELGPLLAAALTRLAEAGADGPAELAETLAGRAARGAVREGIDELRGALPGLEAARGDLHARLVRWLSRSSAEARARTSALDGMGERARLAAAGAARGAFAELEAALPMLERVVESAGSHFVHGMASQLTRELEARPALGATLSRYTEETARRTTSAAMGAVSQELEQGAVRLGQVVRPQLRKALPVLGAGAALLLGLGLVLRR